MNVPRSVRSVRSEQSTVLPLGRTRCATGFPWSNARPLRPFRASDPSIPSSYLPRAPAHSREAYALPQAESKELSEPRPSTHGVSGPSSGRGAGGPAASVPSSESGTADSARRGTSGQKNTAEAGEVRARWSKYTSAMSLTFFQSKRILRRTSDHSIKADCENARIRMECPLTWQPAGGVYATASASRRTARSKFARGSPGR